MTLIIRKAISEKGNTLNRQEIRETKKPIYFNENELAEIDLTETTAYKEFCRIRFKGEKESFWIQSFRLNITE